MRKSAISALAGAFFLAACAATTTAPPRQAGVPGPKQVSAQRELPRCKDLEAREFNPNAGGGSNKWVRDNLYRAIKAALGQCRQ